MFTREGGLEFVTVGIALPAAFMLRANDWISADAAMTLISGILGYVLGQYGSSKSRTSTEATPKQPISN